MSGKITAVIEKYLLNDGTNTISKWEGQKIAKNCKKMPESEAKEGTEFLFQQEAKVAPQLRRSHCSLFKQYFKYHDARKFFVHSKTPHEKTPNPKKNHPEKPSKKPIQVERPSVSLKGGAKTSKAKVLDLGSVLQKDRRFKAAYQLERKRDPHLAGKIVVHFVVSPEGKLLSARITEKTTKNQRFENMILTLAKSVKFPKTGGDQSVSGTFPFLFQ